MRNKVLLIAAAAVLAGAAIIASYAGSAGAEGGAVPAAKTLAGSTHMNLPTSVSGGSAAQRSAAQHAADAFGEDDNVESVNFVSPPDGFTGTSWVAVTVQSDELNSPETTYAIWQATAIVSAVRHEIAGWTLNVKTPTQVWPLGSHTLLDGRATGTPSAQIVDTIRQGAKKKHTPVSVIKTYQPDGIAVAVAVTTETPDAFAADKGANVGTLLQNTDGADDLLLEVRDTDGGLVSLSAMANRIGFGTEYVAPKYRSLVYR